jgi:hypothetical protein
MCVRFEDYLVVYDIESILDDCRRRRLLVDLGVLVVVLLAMHSESLHLSFQRLVLGLLFVLGLSLILVQRRI